jgi:hypothetical protein
VRSVAHAIVHGIRVAIPAKETAMLAEIYLVRLEMQLRIAAANTGTVTTSSDRRFVPVTLTRDTSPKTH